MPRKNAKHQAWLHQQLVEGKTNNATTGKMESPRKNDEETARFVKRAAENSARNKRNAAKRASRRTAAWRRAQEAARAALRKEGDTSEPLPKYVREFLTE